MPDLKKRIIEILSESNTPLKAKMIAKKLGESSAKYINAILYRNRNEFFVNDKYEWSYRNPSHNLIIPSNTKEEQKQVVCSYCGSLFLYDRYKSNRKFCNEKCRVSYYAPKQKEILQETRYCLYCNNAFLWSSSNPNKKYCSSECLKNRTSANSNHSYSSEIRQCANCGASFKWLSSKPSQKYCSVECRKKATLHNSKKRGKNEKNKEFLEGLKSIVFLKVSEIIGKMNQSKGDTAFGKYIDYWEVGSISETTRTQVLERDGFECVVCKRKDNLHLHHLIKRINGGDHSPDNLITLCASCHRHIETGDIQHATAKCLKNAKKYYGIEKEDLVKKEDNNLEELKKELSSLFDKLKESDVGEDTEIMIQIDEALDMISDL